MATWPSSWIYLRAATTLVAIGLVCVVIDWAMVLNVLRGVSVTSVLGAVALGFATHCLLGVRWFVIARGRIGGGLPFHVGVYWRASLFNLLTPGAVGADVYRTVTLRSERVSTVSVAGLVIRERVFGLSGYFLSYLVALALARKRQAFFVGFAPFVALALVGVVLGWMVLTRVGGLLARQFGERYTRSLSQGLAVLRPMSIGDGALILTITLLACGTWFAMIFFLGRQFGTAIGMATATMAAVLAELIRLVPISVQGIGLRESAFGYAFRSAGETFESGVATGAVAYILNNLSLGLAGLVASLAGPNRPH